ncbi:MAG: gluconate 2-dehydrogenase subunit 3 family protein [Myxococcota bacterium]
MIVTVLLLAALAYAVWRLFLGYPRRERTFDHLRPGEVAFLDAAADAMFPAGGALDLSGRDVDLPGYVDRYFATLNGSKRLQIRLLLTLVEQATIFFPAPAPRGRRRFSALSASQRETVLRDWSNSRLFLRRLVFTALRAVLTMGYLGHPSALRQLRLAPYDIQPAIVEADLLYPPIGRHPDSITLTRDDLTGPSDGTPLDLDGPLHPDYAEKPL